MSDDTGKLIQFILINFDKNLLEIKLKELLCLQLCFIIITSENQAYSILYVLPSSNRQDQP